MNGNSISETSEQCFPDLMLIALSAFHYMLICIPRFLIFRFSHVFCQLQPLYLMRHDSLNKQICNALQRTSVQ